MPTSTPANLDLRMMRTRRAIREGFLALLQHKRLDQITGRDIATEAEVGYASFFRHYKSKEDVLKEIAADEINKVLTLVLPLLAEKGSRVTALALCNYVFEHRAIWTALLTGGAAEALRTEFSRIVLAKPLKLRHSWLPMELGAVFGVSSTIEIISWWLQQPDTLTPKQVATILERLILTPTVGDQIK